MSSKGKITDIADIAAIQKQIDTINTGLNSIVKNLENVTANTLKVNQAFSDSKGVKELSGAQAKLNKEATKNFLPMQDGDVKSTYADTDELLNDFNYKPNTDLGEGISKFVEWFKKDWKN